MAKRSTGLQRRPNRPGGTWHIDKRVRGYGRLYESCGTTDLAEAETYLARRLEEIRQATVYGVRPTRVFAQAGTKYLEENQHKRSLCRDAQAIKAILPYIGKLPLERIHNDTLVPYRRDRLKAGIAPGTINRDIAVVRRILNLAARVWRDGQGLTWLATAPLIMMLPDRPRPPYPLTWDEQTALVQALPPHLQSMALFKVNTGLREQEVCRLSWRWEVQVPELGTSVFVLPPDRVGGKNGIERIVVLNRIAKSVITAQRGQHPEYVFTLRGKPVTRIYNSGWKRARVTAGLPHLRVHDLKHTFGHRLRAAGVGFEDRQDLLGHKSGRITTHYSAPDVQRLIEAAERVCEQRATVLRVSAHSKVTQISRNPLRKHAQIG